MKAFYRSGELAKICGCSPDTIRHYESLGLIPKPVRSANRYRQYPKETIDRVRQIQAALTIGFSLKELSEIFKVRDSNGIPCHAVRDLAEAKLKQLESNIKQMLESRQKLHQLIKQWDKRLAHQPKEKRAMLLEQLAHHPIGLPRNSKSSNLKRRK
ncbi:MAG TPA: MerR family transcriptional regulator, partial [Acidobacteriota bacterium]|nr:MerR family transcriptional regulator [Acidobacteriota bacterium]